MKVRAEERERLFLRDGRKSQQYTSVRRNEDFKIAVPYAKISATPKGPDVTGTNRPVESGKRHGAAFLCIRRIMHHFRKGIAERSVYGHTERPQQRICCRLQRFGFFPCGRRKDLQHTQVLF